MVLQDMWTRRPQERPRPRSSRNGGGAFWHNRTGIVRRGWCGLVCRHLGAAPTLIPRGLIRLPHLVEKLHYLIIDDEHDGHVQADPAQAGDSALVESGGGRGKARSEEVRRGQQGWIQMLEWETGTLEVRTPGLAGGLG